MQHIKIDRRRPFGRGAEASAAGMEHLCGACAGGTLCVAPDGSVSPCIMSKRWPIGSVRHERLGDIVQSVRLNEVRTSIGQAVASAQATCDPDVIGCPPLNQCGPQINPAADCMPVCAPSDNPSVQYRAGTCDPSSQCTPVIGCPPLNRCGPEINGVRSRPENRGA